MWEYNHTDELFHSSMYTGTDNTPGIKHWKYIKKVKLPNGKFRYFYNADELRSAENDFRNAVDTENRVNQQKAENERKAWETYMKVAEMEEKMKKAGKSEAEIMREWKKSGHADKQLEETLKALDSYMSSYEALNKRLRAKEKRDSIARKHRRAKPYADAISNALNILNGTHVKKRKKKRK